MLNKVLCVDDDAITLLLCKISLTKSQFTREVATAVNGLEAIEMLKQQQFDLILLDLNMPVKNGWDFLDDFVSLERKCSAPVVILSSSNSPSDLARARSYKPVINFLNKPLTVELLESLKNEEAIKARFDYRAGNPSTGSG